VHDVSTALIACRPSLGENAAMAIAGVTLEARQSRALIFGEQRGHQSLKRIEDFTEFIEIPGIPGEAFCMRLGVRSKPLRIAGEWRVNVFDACRRQCGSECIL